jgi:hypothetical protein
MVPYKGRVFIQRGCVTVIDDMCSLHVYKKKNGGMGKRAVVARLL